MKTRLHYSDLLPEVTHIDVACRRCDRRGRFNVKRLVAEYGINAQILENWLNMNADCPKL